jgi:hypothetical protein
MRRRFVIGIDGLDPAEEKRFRKYISDQGAWWHWIDNMWLMTTKSTDVSAEKILDEVLEINPDARVVVFEFPQDVTWAASGNTNRKGRRLADWIRTPWGAD